MSCLLLTGFAFDRPCPQRFHQRNRSNLKITHYRTLAGVEVLMPETHWRGKQVAFFPGDCPFLAAHLLNHGISFTFEHVKKRFATMPMKPRCRDRCAHEPDGI